MVSAAVFSHTGAAGLYGTVVFSTSSEVSSSDRISGSASSAYRTAGVSTELCSDSLSAEEDTAFLFISFFSDSAGGTPGSFLL